MAWSSAALPGAPAVLRRLARIGRYPYAVLRDVAGGQINMRATALVFTTVLSLVPLLAFSFIIIRELGGASRGARPCSPSCSNSSVPWARAPIA